MLIAALLLQAAAPLPAPVSAPTELWRGIIPVAPARTYEGIWLDIFQASDFAEGASRFDEIDRAKAQRTRLVIDRTRGLQDMVDRHTPGARLPEPYIPHLYHIRFTGFDAEDAGCGRAKPAFMPPCVGFDRLTVVGQVVDIVDLGPMPLVNSDSRR